MIWANFCELFFKVIIFVCKAALFVVGLILMILGFLTLLAPEFMEADENKNVYVVSAFLGALAMWTIWGFVIWGLGKHKEKMEIEKL